jgi:phosphohistidine phosphatase
MKTLYFVRHAKSSWKHTVGDRHRPLKEQGIKDALQVSKLVAQTIVKPQLITASDALRTQSTATYFKDAFELKNDAFVVNPELYDFSGQQVMKLIKELKNTLDCVMLCGHNHAFTSIVNILGSISINNVPTCGFVAITFDVDKWCEITTGTTIKTVFPRDLK